MKMQIRTFLIALLIVCFGLAPLAQAVVPAPVGGYPGFNTATGQNALAPAAPGVWNTAIGGFTLANDAPGGNGNTAVGLNALRNNTTGDFNTAVGLNACLFNLTGRENTAIGTQALNSNQTATRNTGVGFQALFANNNHDNTAVGWRALFNNTGRGNCAVGSQALNRNTTGDGNTAEGSAALYNNTTGDLNAANGASALFSNTGGSLNTATGASALYHNTVGNSNTATGVNALVNNTIGWENTAVGGSALESNTTGARNTAHGTFALLNNITGIENTAIGVSAGSSITGSGNVCIGALVNGVAGESNTTRIRNIYTTVQPIVGTDPDYVTINSSGRLGRGSISSRRYKHDIKPMDKASEVLFALKPVSFRYNKQHDATQTIAFGLIAEDVAEVYPDLVGRNAEGQPESVRYEQINAMLLNEFLKEHKAVQKQGGMIAELKKEIAALTATVKEQAAQIQKVSAQFEMSKPAPQTVLNNY